MLLAAHVEGIRNVLADQIGREVKTCRKEWSLKGTVEQKIWLRFYKPHRNVFASALDHKLLSYCSRVIYLKTWSTCRYHEKGYWDMPFPQLF